MKVSWWCPRDYSTGESGDENWFHGIKNGEEKKNEEKVAVSKTNKDSIELDIQRP